MKIVQTILILSLFLPLGSRADVFDEIQSNRMGVVLANATIFSDTSFTAPTSQYFRGGSLVTVIEETKNDHEDDAQKQRYKWYQVTDGAGKQGWVFGDGLLVKEKDDLLSKTLSGYAYQKFRFNSGFENSMIWFGSIVGRDNFGSQMLSRNYEESYLIITNELGRSVYIPIANSSQFGQSEVTAFFIQELTGDQTPELIVETSVLNIQNNLEESETQKVVNLYTFQAGTLRKVFEERLNQGDQFKHLIFEKGLIRGHYFENSSATNQAEKPQFFSYTYFWNKRSRQYELLYPAAPSALRAVPTTYGLYLKASPESYAKTVAPLRTSSQLRILNLINQSYIERGKTYHKICAEVISDKGQKGYVPFEYLSFPDFKNSDWIKASLLNSEPAMEALSCIELPEIAADTSSINR